MGLARELAQRIVALRYEDLPTAAIQGSRVGLMDTIGVLLAGANETPAKIVRQMHAPTVGTGPCRIMGTSQLTNALDAAIINGTAAHALDYDNGSNSMGGHVSATMVPAIIAAAEAFDASGRDLLLAHTVGFETGARIGHGVNFHHYEVGWHPTSTLGTFAVTAACASLLKLDTAQTEVALGIATSLAAGIKANFSTMVKPLHVGQCARNGLTAALLARDGFSASALAFEDKQGFLNVFNGAGNYDTDRILDRWANPLEIVEPGAGYKQYPCCAATHSAVDVALELVNRHGRFNAADIVSIHTWTSARRLAHTNRPAPQSNLDAKFSVQYCVTRALLEGQIVLEHFEAEAYRDPLTRDVMQHFHAAVHTPGQFPPENHFGAEVKVTLRDGTLRSGRIDIQLGRTSDNPVPPERLRTKFKNCSGRVLSTENVERVLAMLDQLEDLSDARELTALLVPPATSLPSKATPA